MQKFQDINSASWEEKQKDLPAVAFAMATPAGILDRIDYAKRIQTALITNEKYITRKLKIINYK